MVHRKRRRRLVLVALLAFVLGTTAFAYAANITFSGGAGRAGEGTGTISGYDVTNVKYTLDTSDPANITGVEFTLSPNTATKAQAKIGAGAWATCVKGATTWTCPVSGGAQAAVELKVAAAD
ncbi:MAG TPA: hypothetical protein VFG57_10760 [Gaiella sp.]|jgi:hypothetical protein|nr:hypothetical protein [Gaiella sp.]